MRDLAFFEPVAQDDVAWRDRKVKSPVFYYDLSCVMVHFLTSLEAIRRLLPSDRLQPMRITPRTAVTTVTFYQHRDSDIGAYNELLVGFPVTIDRRAPMGWGFVRSEITGASICIRHLPVTTEIARDLGIDVAGYPKILADIEVDASGGRVSCAAAAEGRTILTMSIDQPRPKPVFRRWSVDAITVREGFVQRVPAVKHLRHLGRSMRGDRVQLELGDHPIGEEMRSLDLGRAIAIRYAPDCQMILGRPIEGWQAASPAADRAVDRPADAAAGIG
jgi:hypothetical protein